MVLRGGKVCLQPVPCIGQAGSGCAVAGWFGAGAVVRLRPDQHIQRLEEFGRGGRLLVTDPAGVTMVIATGLQWRGEVYQQVFEEAAVDLGRALAGFSDSRRGRRRGVPVGFPRFRRKAAGSGSFRIRNKTSRTGATSIRVGEVTPRSVTLPKIGTVLVREDTRRLRRMLAKQRATIMSVTVTYRLGSGRWTAALVVQAADLHPAAQHPPRDHGDTGGWVGVDRGLSALVVAAGADGGRVLRVDDPPRPCAPAWPGCASCPDSCPTGRRDQPAGERPSPGCPATISGCVTFGTNSCIRSPGGWSRPTTGSCWKTSTSPADRQPQAGRRYQRRRLGTAGPHHRLPASLARRTDHLCRSLVPVDQDLQPLRRPGHQHPAVGAGVCLPGLRS